MVRAAVCAALTLSVMCVAASSAPAAKKGDADVFGGLGTWVDIYDGSVYAASERTARRMAARQIKTVWVETANFGASVDVVDPVRLGRLVDALHARGIRIVAWYLPGHVRPALDMRRALAMLSFRTPTGAAFDGVALDIESTKLRNASLRSQRAVASRSNSARPPATCRSPSSRSIPVASNGARRRGRAFPGRISPKAPTRLLR